MWTHTRHALVRRAPRAEIASSKSLARGRVDREGRQVAQVAAVAPGSGPPRRRASAARSTAPGEAAPQAAVEHQRLDHVARDVGAPDPPRAPWRGRAPGPPVRSSTRSPAPRPAVAVDHDRGARARRTACRRGSARASRAGRRWRRPVGRVTGPRRASARSADVERLVAARVRGLSCAGTFGLMPSPRRSPPPPRLRPLGVKYSPTVRSSAPPLGSSLISWKTPLPNVRVPTTSRAGGPAAPR